MVVYGLWTAALCISSFVIVLFGFGHGNFGHNCNNSIEDGCEVVFRARATTFTSLTWFALFLAWEMINMRRSFFNMRPDSKHHLSRWIRDVWPNQFLFWAIFAGFVTIFPLIYIPVINTKVFKHAPISWEWVIVFVNTLFFFVGVEGWKLGKRIYYHRLEKSLKLNDNEAELQVFSIWNTSHQEV